MMSNEQVETRSTLDSKSYRLKQSFDWRPVFCFVYLSVTTEFIILRLLIDFVETAML